jgi:hypothetical protein
VKASHPDAKQLFFGWGSDRDPIDASFYGSEDRTDTWHGNFDYKRWQWKLSMHGVERMISNIENHIDDLDYYSKKERPKARELLALLKKIEKLG